MRISLVFLFSLLLLTACNAEESPPAPTPTITSEPIMNSIPTLGFASPTLESNVIAVDDLRLPIAPDPSGKTLYEANCASCHGINGEGQFPDDPYKIDANGLAGAPPHDPTGHTWHHPDQTLIMLITKGRSQPGSYPMPGFEEKLTQEEIVSILAYIKTMWGTQELETQYQTTENYQP